MATCMLYKVVIGGNDTDIGIIFTSYEAAQEVANDYVENRNTIARVVIYDDVTGEIQG